MKKLIILITILIITIFCLSFGNEEQVKSDNTFDIKVENLVETEDVIIMRLIISAKDDRKITIINDTFNVYKNNAEIILFADLVKNNSEDKNQLKFLYQGKSGGTLMVSSEANLVDKEKKLSELIKFTIESGKYNYGEAINIGSKSDLKLILTVK